MEIEIRVDGIPVPKPRMTRRDKWAKRPCVLRYYEYKDRILSVLPPIDEDLVLTSAIMSFHFSTPKSWSKRKKVLAHAHYYHWGKPDIDNLAKGFLDSVTNDDSNVYAIECYKFWTAEPHTIGVLNYEKRPQLTIDTGFKKSGCGDNGRCC